MQRTDSLNRSFSFKNAFVHFSYQALAGIIYGFSVYMFIERGFNSSTAGVAMAIANFLGLVLQPAISNFLDKTKKITVFEVLLVISIMISVIYICNSFVENGSFFIVIIYIFSIILFAAIEPLINSISNVLQINNIDVNFSRARACGSFSYGIVCMAFGVLTENYSYPAVIFGGFSFALLLTFASLLIRNSFKKIDKVEVVYENIENISFMEFIKTNTKFILLCVCLVGIFFAYTCQDNFMYLIVENVGGDSKDMGIVLGLKAILEGVVMFGFYQLLKRFKLNTILITSIIFFTVKSFSLSIVKTVELVYASEIFQMFSFALIIPSMIEYINTNIDTRASFRANALFTMTITGGAIISSLLGGTVADNLGVNAMNYMSLIVSFVSSLCFILILIKEQKHD